ncbi:MAG TPA: flavin-dependent monooxygenase [Stellaceae bacterium]|nr:flavin-dependent monooxygenase [Stellaceae bacterium]
MSPAPDLAELKRRTETLLPRLRERAVETETLRRIPDATIADLHAAGLFRMLQPRRVGGSEAPYRALVDVGAIIARACGSTAWVLTNLASHHWMLGMWPQQAQDEIWGGDGPDVLIGSAFAFPAGRASRAAGGWRLKGRWPFSSGIDPSRWTMIGALVEENDAVTESRIFIVPRNDYTVIDNWHAAGLAGTGSKDVAVADIFVPDHRSVTIGAIAGGPSPGSAINPGALYRLPTFSVFPFILSSVALGIAQGAIAEFTGSMRARAATYTGKRVAELATLQLRLAEAAALTDAAEKTMLADCAEATALAEAASDFPADARARWRRDGAFTTRMCVEAVDLVFTGAGGNAIYLTNPLQRAWRDVHAAGAHVVVNWDAAGTLYGRVALGLPADVPAL